MDRGLFTQPVGELELNLFKFTVIERERKVVPNQENPEIPSITEITKTEHGPYFFERDVERKVLDLYDSRIAKGWQSIEYGVYCYKDDRITQYTIIKYEIITEV